MSTEEKKLSSKEKLQALQKQVLDSARRVGELELVVFNLSRTNDVLRDALQLMNNKLSAVIALSNEGGQLTDENIDEKIVLLKELELKDKVDDQVAQGNLTPAEVISNISFVVSRELSKDGKVENPRLQFLVERLNDELKEKFLGKKVGYILEGTDDKLDVEVVEIYDKVEQVLDPAGQANQDQKEAQEEQESPKEDSQESAGE